MVEITGKSVFSYILELLAGLAIIIGALMIIPVVIQGDVIGIILAVVLLGGGIYVFKRPGRDRRKP